MPHDQASSEPASPWRVLLGALGWFALATLATVPLGVLEGLHLLPRGLLLPLILLVVPLVLLVPVLRAGGLGGRFRGPSAGVVETGLVFLAVLAANLAIIRLLSLTVADLGKGGGGHGFAWLRFLGIALAAPLVEELFYRGWLWDRLSRSWPPRRVALATGIAFAASHAQFALTVIPITIGLTWLRLRGGLRAPLALHLLNNTLAATIGLMR